MRGPAQWRSRQQSGPRVTSPPGRRQRGPKLLRRPQQALTPARQHAQACLTHGDGRPQPHSISKTSIRNIHNHRQGFRTCACWLYACGVASPTYLSPVPLSWFACCADCDKAGVLQHKRQQCIWRQMPTSVTAQHQNRLVCSGNCSRQEAVGPKGEALRRHPPI